MGDLYAQGREIAFFKGVDPDGSTANQTNVWGVIPYKGLIYFADLNNGLWAVRLVDNEPLGTNQRKKREIINTTRIYTLTMCVLCAKDYYIYYATESEDRFALIRFDSIFNEA